MAKSAKRPAAKKAPARPAPASKSKTAAKAVAKSPAKKVMKPTAKPAVKVAPKSAPKAAAKPASKSVAKKPVPKPKASVKAAAKPATKAKAPAAKPAKPVKKGSSRAVPFKNNGSTPRLGFSAAHPQAPAGGEVHSKPAVPRVELFFDAAPIDPQILDYRPSPDHYVERFASFAEAKERAIDYLIELIEHLEHRLHELKKAESYGHYQTVQRSAAKG
ncbi:MAG: hypothetical protein K2Y37_24040 [Pirellulales bacterium]|nr:hypothetical protein [Pirellulales bacterium]